MSVEVMFTSLLVQAQIALQSESASAPPGSRTRSRGFRSSFLTGYADRIGERLRRVAEAVTDEVEADRAASGATSLLPVLASRSAMLDAEIERLFPKGGDEADVGRRRRIRPRTWPCRCGQGVARHSGGHRRLLSTPQVSGAGAVADRPAVLDVVQRVEQLDLLSAPVDDRPAHLASGRLGLAEDDVARAHVPVLTSIAGWIT